MFVVPAERNGVFGRLEANAAVFFDNGKHSLEKF
jgi:hypothetical protein